MLAVKPVLDPAVAEELCKLCEVPYKADSYTYFAADVNEDATKINFIIGVCTCRMKGSVNELEALKSAPGVDDEEALIIMARTVMNFMYRCEVKRVTMDPAYTDADLTKKLGFTPVGDELVLDLVAFYKAPCKFGH